MKLDKSSRLFSKNYCLLILVSLITSFGYSMIATLISSYAVELGAGLTLAGTLAGIYSLSALLIRPFGGYATDILNKKKMCIFSTVAICIAMAGYAVVPGIKSMFVVRVLHGVAFGISGTANMAMIFECIPKNRLVEGMGYYGLGQVVAQVCGPNLGISIKDKLGYKTLFLIIAIMTVLAILLLLLISNKYEHIENNGKIKEKVTLHSLIAKECIIYALVAGMFSLGNGIINSFLFLVSIERNIVGIGLFFSVNSIVLFMIRIIIGKIAGYIRFTIIVNVSLITSAVSMIFVGEGTVLWIMLIAAALKAVGQASGQISLQSACLNSVDEKRVGIAASTYYIGADIGQGLGPIIGGKFSTFFGYRAMFYSIAILILLTLVLFNIYQKHLNNKVLE